MIRAGALLVVASAACATAAFAQQDSTPPGEWLDGPAMARRDAFQTCPSLPWHGPRGNLSDSVTARTCQVDTTGALSSAWSFARYRHSTVYAPGAATRVEDRANFPDTLPEDELVIFAAAGDSLRPVWHDRLDTRATFPKVPVLAHRPEGDFLQLTYCVNGTGGCWMDVLRATRARPWPLVRQAFAARFRSRLPAGWGTWKGIWLHMDSLTASAPLYAPGDRNCCSSFEATLRLVLRGDSLLLAGTRIAPQRGVFGTVLIPGYSAGGIGPGTSLAELEGWFSPAQLAPAALELGEGICTPGTVVAPGTTNEAEIAWADSGRTRVAFVRITHQPTSWKTAQGVTIGTTLDSLVRIAGRPLEFSGWGWDYGGGMTWTEPVPPGLGAPPGRLTLTLALDSASNERLQALLGTDPRADDLYGDRPVRSDHPLLRQLTAVVTDLYTGFADAAIQQDCR